MISASRRYRWIASVLGRRHVMQLAQLNHNSDTAPTFEANGQILAGTGALVFEGELLELPRQK